MPSAEAEWAIDFGILTRDWSKVTGPVVNGTARRDGLDTWEKSRLFARGRQGLARALDKKDGALTGEPRIFDATNSFSRLAWHGYGPPEFLRIGNHGDELQPSIPSKRSLFPQQSGQRSLEPIAPFEPHEFKHEG
jgi:hypothetical protein